ncbi:MAG: 3-hydroxyacyl-CoA dehydrogenase NAD-binding domain-containing protein [Candidatus Ratteibacteria bacterium]|jgi:3-hydroxybutyryl-CoA dehydrogenase
MRKIFVLGAGTMGTGIAQAAAEAGYEVILADLNTEYSERAKKKIAGFLDKKREKDQLREEGTEEILSRITITADLQKAAGTDLVIEAILEEPKAKQKVFTGLDTICAPETVLATNTSALSISAIASSTTHPERVVGIHFFNPVAKMKLVEIVRGKQTCDETVAKALAFAEQLKKVPVLVNESPGFIVNRLLIPMINEAAYALQDGVAEKEAIDTAMKLGAAHPMGPLELADLIGLDVCLHIMEIFEREFASDKYAPAPILKKMVQEGNLGRKTGRGFYKYPR